MTSTSSSRSLSRFLVRLGFVSAGGTRVVKVRPFLDRTSGASLGHRIRARRGIASPEELRRRMALLGSSVLRHEQGQGPADLAR